MGAWRPWVAQPALRFGFKAHPAARAARLAGLRVVEAIPLVAGMEAVLIVALGPAAALRCWGHLTLGWHACPRRPAWCRLWFHALGGQQSPLLGPGRRESWCARPAGGPMGLPSMDTLVGPWGWVVPTCQPGSPSLACRWLACFFNEPVMLLGFVLLGRLP